MDLLDHGRTSTPEGRLVSPAMVFFTAAHDVEHVASRDAQNVEIDRVVPIDGHGLRLRRTAIFHLGHITNQHRMVLAQLHHRVADVGDLRGNRIGVDVGVEFVRDELAGGQQRIGLRDRTGHIGGGKATRLRARGINDDVDLPLAAAVDRCAGNARNAFEQGLDIVEGIVVQLRPGQAPQRPRPGSPVHSRGRTAERREARRQGTLGTADIAKATCCCTRVWAELRSVPHFIQT